MSIEKNAVNAKFLEILNDGGLTDLEKSAQFTKVGSGLLKLFVEQEGFTGRIIPPEQITREQCIPTGIEGSFYIRRPIDNGDRVNAVDVARTGYPTGRYISGTDYPIFLTYKESDVFQKSTREIQDSYTIDIQDIYENRIGLGLQKRTDKNFMAQVYSGLGYNTATGALKAGGSKQIVDFRPYHGASTASLGVVSEMIVRMKQYFSARATAAQKAATSISLTNANFEPDPLKPLIASTVLMNIYDFEDFSEMPATDMGSILRAEYFQGYKMNTFKNLNIVTTIHSDLVPRGTMLFFALPEFIGHNFEVDPIQVKTKVDSFNHTLMVKGEAFNGIGLGNFYGIWQMLFTPRGIVPAAPAQPNLTTLGITL